MHHTLVTEELFDSIKEQRAAIDHSEPSPVRQNSIRLVTSTKPLLINTNVYSLFLAARKRFQQRIACAVYTSGCRLALGASTYPVMFRF